MKTKMLISSISLISAIVLLSAIVCGAFSTEVYLDGTKIGVTPLTVKIEGMGRYHKIEVRKEGYHSKVAIVFNESPGFTVDWYPHLLISRTGITEILEESTLHLSLASK